jgi:hypothetical protein
MRRGLCLAAFLLPSGCGYIGGPLTPLANVPTRISDLAAIQRGDTIVAHCTLPTYTTENILINTPLALDLRVGAAGEHFNAADWAHQAKLISGAQIKDGIATFRIPSKEWTGKEVAIGVRAIGSNGKASDWSNYEMLSVVVPPQTPTDVDVKDVAAGERITWAGRGDRFRVVRHSGDEEGYTVVATIDGHEYTDPGIEYGKPYSYQVQALVDAGNSKTAESDLSAPVPITPKDTFAPAVPSGLRADLAPTSVVLAWEPDTETDLAGYRVYRSVAGGPWQKLADVNGIPSYSDTTIEHGKTYQYAVSAIDKAANESARSAPLEIVP